MNIFDTDKPLRGAGLSDLRKRMKRRAVFLSTDMEFAQSASGVRDLWNTDRRRKIRTDESPTYSERIEEHLERDKVRKTDHTIRDPNYWKDFNDMWTLSTAMAQFFFPRIDFYWPGISTQHPAAKFCRRMIETGHCEPGEIDIENPVPLNFLGVLFENGGTINKAGTINGDALLQRWAVGVDSGMMPLYFPLYPGVTEKDIRDAASKAAESAREHFEQVSTPSRVRYYRDQELTQQAVADKLGLPVKTVRTILKETEQVSKLP